MTYNEHIINPLVKQYLKEQVIGFPEKMIPTTADVTLVKILMLLVKGTFGELPEEAVEEISCI
jgi:hypothetical protein